MVSETKCMVLLLTKALAELCEVPLCCGREQTCQLRVLAAPIHCAVSIASDAGALLGSRKSSGSQSSRLSVIGLGVCSGVVAAAA